MTARRHPVLAWLVLGAFLLASLSPPRHLPMGAAPGLGALGELIVLCTPQGVKLVRFGEQAPDAPDKPTQGRVCPVCIGLQLAGLATLAPPPSIVAPAAVAYVAPISPIAGMAPALFRQTPQPRGPPSVDSARLPNDMSCKSIREGSFRCTHASTRPPGAACFYPPPPWA
jgi:hypothetical protein